MALFFLSPVSLGKAGRVDTCPVHSACLAQRHCISEEDGMFTAENAAQNLLHQPTATKTNTTIIMDVCPCQGTRVGVDTRRYHRSSAVVTGSTSFPDFYFLFDPTRQRSRSVKPSHWLKNGMVVPGRQSCHGFHHAKKRTGRLGRVL